jgi:hypothetical protein
MTDLLVIAAVFTAAIVVTELLAGGKLQTVPGRVIVCQVIAFALVVRATRTVPMAAVFVFWTGAFALWFGLRSHVESSILLRMLTWLSDRPATRDEILEWYNARYGRAHRADGLVRAGLVTASDGVLTPTAKGRLIVRVAQLLR